ncbi:MAG: hypothetical protein ACKPKO_22935, partial [Candidatus Fonsibacter sp.]
NNGTGTNSLSDAQDTINSTARTSVWTTLSQGPPKQLATTIICMQAWLTALFLVVWCSSPWQWGQYRYRKLKHM